MLVESNDSQIYHHDSSNSILDELDKIYLGVPDAENVVIFRPEQIADPDIRQLYAVGDAIMQARSLRLDSQFYVEANN